MTEDSRFGEYSLAGSNDRGGCNALLSLTTICLVCREQARAPVLTLGHPYHGLLCAEPCARFFAFDGHYPHPFAIPVMMARGRQSSTHDATRR